MNKANGPTRKLSEDVRKEFQKFNAQDVKRARVFKEMLRHEGWPMFVSLLNSYINDRMNTVIGPTPPQGELTSEHVKGTVYGLIMARDTIPAIIADYEQFSKDSGLDDDEDAGKGPEHPPVPQDETQGAKQ